MEAPPIQHDQPDGQRTRPRFGPVRMLFLLIAPLAAIGFMVHILLAPLLAEVEFIAAMERGFSVRVEYLAADPDFQWDWVRNRLGFKPPPVRMWINPVDDKSKLLTSNLRLRHLKELTIAPLMYEGMFQPATMSLAWIGQSKALESLDFNKVIYTDDQLAFLSGLTRLQSLGLQGRLLNGTFFSHLPESIERLHLEDVNADQSWAVRFSRLTGLKVLSIHMSKVDPAVTDALFALPSLEHLGLGSVDDLWPQKVDLSRSKLRKVGLIDCRVERRVMADLARIPSLTALSFAKSRLDVAAIAELAPLKRLESLDLSSTNLDDSAMPTIQGLRRLKELDLRQTKVTSRGIEHLGGLPNLQKLDLLEIQLDDAAIDHLLTIPNLTDLGIFGTAVTDKNFERLVRQGRLRSLSALSIAITPKAMDALLQKTTLRELHVDESLVNPELLEAIKKVNPDLKINDP